MAVVILIFCSSLLFPPVLQSAGFVLCFSNSAGSSLPKTDAHMNLTCTPRQGNTQLCTVLLQALFFREEMFCSSEGDPHPKAGDQGCAAAAHVVQFRPCLVVP